MLGDTLVFPLGGVNVTCRKVNQDQYSAEYRYRSSVNQLVLRVRHSQTKANNGTPAKDRHNFEVVETVFASGSTPELTRKSYWVWEHEPSDTNLAIVDGMADMIIASTNDLVTKMGNWES